MKISTHQKRVLEYLKEGYVIKFVQRKVSHSWWLFKDMGKGYIHTIDLLSSTVENLLSLSLIRFKKTDKYRHKIYTLSPKWKKHLKEKKRRKK